MGEVRWRLRVKIGELTILSFSAVHLRGIFADSVAGFGVVISLDGEETWSER